jgi:hypothetical protein
MAGVAPPGPNNAWIFEGLLQVIIYMAPHKALAKQKRWMRRFCRKPQDMLSREYVNHICRITTTNSPTLSRSVGMLRSCCLTNSST